MKKVLFMIFLTILGITDIMAQSGMTDAQIVDFVIKEQKAGTSQSQIVVKLMQRGVDVQQIRRIKKKYDRQIKDQGLGNVADDALKNADSRMRKNNSDPKKSTSEMVSNNGNKTTTPNDPNYAIIKSELDNMNLSVSSEDAAMDIERPFITEDEKGPKVFGRDIFNKEKLTFEPNMNISTPQNYRLGPGDKIYIDIYGASQKTVECEVSPDGEVTIEGFGPVKVSGLTVDEANAKLRNTLGSRYASSKVKLTVGQTRTIMINVMGEVKMPGTYTLSAFATVFHALYMAGGVSDIGTLRNIKVYRQGKLVSQVDVYDYILNGKLTGNVRLTDNDVIVVGTYDCLVNITGKVKRPMYYEMKKNESMQSLLKYSGGFANDAYTQSVRVIRKNGRQYSVFNVTEFDMSSFRVADGDSVSVDSIIPRYENMVEVKGAVFRPGLYQLGNEINSVKTLLKMCEGPTEDAFTAHGVMHRMKKDRTLEVISVDVEGILNGSIADIPLQNEDVLFLPSKNTSMEQQTITIHGEVHYPGVYRYADNETLEDFVLQAGGLKESASVMKVDVSRRVIDPKATATSKTIAETFSFELQDGFVISGESAFKLKPFDEVYVRKNPSYTKMQNINVEGQVNFPGTYTLAKKDTRLSDVIKQAGGVTESGYVHGARLERRLTEDERARLNNMLKMAKANTNSKDSIDINKLDISDTYSVGIELGKALANPSSNYDILLREGDRLIIPEYNGTVKVNGAVMHPNTLSFVEGKSAKWYIKHAGGYSNLARKRKAYIIHQSGMTEEVAKGVKVTPGSEIVVPERNTRDKTNSAEYIAIGTGFASLGTMIATIATLFK